MRALLFLAAFIPSPAAAQHMAWCQSLDPAARFAVISGMARVPQALNGERLNHAIEAFADRLGARWVQCISVQDDLAERSYRAGYSSLKASGYTIMTVEP